MIVRVRDLVSALLLFPLALAGFTLGIGVAVLVVEAFDSFIGTSSATAGANRSSSDLSSWAILLIALAIPTTYFYFIRKKMRDHPHHLYFGELSGHVFFALTITVFVLPLFAAFILMSVVF